MEWTKEGGTWRPQANATASTVPDHGYTMSSVPPTHDEARLEAFRQRVKALDTATAEEMLLLLHETGALTREECILWRFVLASVKSAKE